MIMLLPRVSKGSIGEAIDEGSHGSSFVSWSGEGHGGEGEQSLKICVKHFVSVKLNFLT